MTAPESVPEWKDLVDASRLEWEDDDHRDEEPVNEDQRTPRSAVEPDPPPFQPRPVEPPYRRRSWPWPYQSRESPVANPNNLNPRELSALQKFFKTRAEQPRTKIKIMFVRREVGKFSVPA